MFRNRIKNENNTSSILEQGKLLLALSEDKRLEYSEKAENSVLIEDRF